MLHFEADGLERWLTWRTEMVSGGYYVGYAVLSQKPYWAFLSKYFSLLWYKRSDFCPWLELTMSLSSTTHGEHLMLPLPLLELKILLLNVSKRNTYISPPLCVTTSQKCAWLSLSGFTDQKDKLMSKHTVNRLQGRINSDTVSSSTGWSQFREMLASSM